jgi:two-component system, OmpR family, sensor kinase
MRDMRISVLTTLFFGLMLAAAICSGLLTLWHGAQSRNWDQRISLAQASYAEHLKLQSNIYQLFKQHSDALLFGDRDEGALETSQRARISENLATIRKIVGTEIELVGGEEIEELELLSQIEGKVTSLTRALSRLNEAGQPANEAARRQALIAILDAEVDDKLALKITVALEGERAEVVETLAEAEAFHSRVRVAVVALMTAAIGFAGLAWVTYRRQIVRPTERLAAKIEAFQRGEDRIGALTAGAWELRQLDNILESMIAALDQRELTNHELTEQLERAVQARTAELSSVLTQIERSEAARRQMMADVSHELRTPLTIIQGEADVSLRGAVKTSEIYAESLSRIRETARHANQVVDDLLLIARQESGKLRLDLHDVDLCTVLRETVALLPQKVTLDLALAQARTKADPMRIRQCLLALFQNASRYGGSTIWARIEAAPGGYSLIVEDNGPGMSDVEKAQAFDRFFRGSNAARPDVEGTGLGLPIVRAIARAHDGTVSLEDRPGGGLRVVMTLAAERPIGLVWDNEALPAKAP